MKNILKIRSLMMAALLIAALASCNKDDDDDDNGDGNNPTTQEGMEATINGSEWKATSTIAVIDNDAIAISGVKAKGEQLSFSLAGTQTGTYNFGISSENSAIFSPGNSVYYTAGANAIAGGTVEVMDLNLTDSIVSGTFSFNLYNVLGNDSIIITGGTFSKVKVNSGGGVK